MSLKVLCCSYGLRSSRQARNTKLYNKLQEGYDMVCQTQVSPDKKLKVILANLFYSVYGFAVGQKYDPEAVILA